ncbi:SnoaL-like protein [Actinomycetospora succinea]|uniref:SnoaL-like protein n=1 Tax=Actinomycetospora succinea TaxID=663603 RepID=A0A4R6VI24_9PSEU|nr:nuclear transport factor 2 family protein [Actinomycetospora succinea]TDQ61120.1 SnoaL-like protein [Actinomycetospora succinea]
MRTPTETMTAYFEGWQRHDAESLRDVLADDVVFDGPMGHVEGVDDNVKSLHGLLSIVTDVTIRQVFADGPDVCTIYDLHTTETDAPMLTVNWAHVVEGRARTIRAIFDPRPLVG